MPGSTGRGRRSSVLLALPLDTEHPDTTLDEAVILVRQLGAVVKRIDHRNERRALVMRIPVSG